MGQPLRRLPPAETLSYLLLTMTAISGEFPSHKSGACQEGRPIC